jgi:outer membrane protein insertion porin family
MIKLQANKNVWLLCFMAIVVSACSSTKYVPENDFLYKGVNFKVDSGKIDKPVLDGMPDMIRPKANASMAGVPFKLMLYPGPPDPAKKKDLLIVPSVNGQNPRYY